MYTEINVHDIERSQQVSVMFYLHPPRHGEQGGPCDGYVSRYKVKRADASDAGRHDAFRNPSHRGVALEALTGTILLLMIYKPPTTKPPMRRVPYNHKFLNGLS